MPLTFPDHPFNRKLYGSSYNTQVYVMLKSNIRKNANLMLLLLILLLFLISSHHSVIVIAVIIIPNHIHFYFTYYRWWCNLEKCLYLLLTRRKLYPHNNIETLSLSSSSEGRSEEKWNFVSWDHKKCSWVTVRCWCKDDEATQLYQYIENSLIILGILASKNERRNKYLP